MPAPICYAHKLVERQAEVRKSGLLPWLRPDAKSQVSCRYENGKVTGLDAVVLSTQHDPDVQLKDLREAVMELIIKHVLPKEWLKRETKFHINPTGNFVIGGPVGDCGLTGRKIIVDSYGGMARHGGGAFSGKDPSKVDRSAAYAARYVAKNLVAAGLADRCEIQVSYAIGVAEPTSITVDTFGTGKVSQERLEQLVRAHFDLRPYGIIKMLDLVHPMYRSTSAYGHFGREPVHTTYKWKEFIGGKKVEKSETFHGLHVGTHGQGRGAAQRRRSRSVPGGFEPPPRRDSPTKGVKVPAFCGTIAARLRSAATGQVPPGSGIGFTQPRSLNHVSFRRANLKSQLARTVTVHREDRPMNAAVISATGQDFAVADLGARRVGPQGNGHRRDRNARPDGHRQGIREGQAACRARASPARCT